MKHIKLFEQFTTEKQLEFDFDRNSETDTPTMDDTSTRELGTMGFPTTHTFIFESPIFIQVDYESWFEKASQYGVDEFMRQADDFENDIVSDFNESKLEEYSDVPGVETIRAKGITRDGNFIVEVVALSDLDIDAIKEELSGQYSDGWGEGYEQTEHKLDDVSYYVHTWRERDFEIKLVNP